MKELMLLKLMIIMAGAVPREPKGWSDDDQTKGKPSKKTSIKGAAEEL